MEEIVVRFMESHGSLAIYLAIMVCGFVEYLFPPFPSDTLLLIAGVLAGEGVLDPLVVFMLTVLGSMVGAICLYQLGLTKGREFFIRKDYPFFPRERIAKLEDWFARHGAKIIIVNRFFSGFRAVFFVAAGIGRMRFLKVCLYGALGSAIWTALIIIAGYVVGRNWSAVLKYLRIYSSAIVLLVAVIFLLALIRYFAGKKKQARCDFPRR